MVQQVTSKIKILRVEDLFISIIVFLIIIGITILKILYINQTFSGQNDKQILQFTLTVRILRCIKITINCFSVLILGPENISIIMITLACVDFVVTYYQITFISIDNQQSLLLATNNNILSIVVSGFLQVQKYSLWYFSPEIFLFCFFLLISHSMQPIIQLKYGYLFKNLNLSRNDFKKQKQKQTIILLLQCFRYIYSFDHPTKLKIKQQALNQWSQIFIRRLNLTYQSILYFYFCQTEYQIELKDQPRKKLILSQLQSDLQAKITEKYNQIYSKKCKIGQILEDKTLFFNFVAFCMDNLQNKQSPDLPWSYSNQFFLIFICKFNANFIMKKMFYFCRRSNLTQSSLLYKVRNRKVGAHLRNFQQHYGMYINDLQEYMLFENSLKKLKTMLSTLCIDQYKLIQKLANPVVYTFQCQSNLCNRKNKKQQVLMLIQSMFNHSKYICHQQFTYLFLMFMIMFCKSIYLTAEILRQKFIVPTKKLTVRDYQIASCPVLVCCCLENNEYKFGDIAMSNVAFRKKFGFIQNQMHNTSKRVNDLIVGNQQKAKHLQLMLNSSNSSENILEKKNHSQYDCYLKINLQCDQVHIIQQFFVQTRFFYGLKQNLMYICQLKQKNKTLYLLQTDFLKIQAKTPSLSQIKLKSNIIEKTQLGLEIKLRLMDKNQLQNLNFLRTNQQFEDDLSMKLQNPGAASKIQCISKQQFKFSKIQESIWGKNSNSQKKLIRLIFCSAFWFLFCIICCFGILLFTSYKSYQSKTIQSQISNLMSTTQGCQIRFSAYLYLLKQIENGNINISVCNKYTPDIRPLLKDLTNKCLKNRINQFFFQYYQKGINSIPILDTQFVKSMRIESITQIDYTNYIILISSTILNFMSTDLADLTAQQKKQINKFIKQHSNIGSSSFSYLFINFINKNTEDILKQYKISFNFVYITFFILGVITAVIFLYFLIKIFAQVLKYFDLLTKMPESYFYQRIHQVKFINKQIQQMNDYNFKKCNFISNNQISIQTQTFDQIKEIELNLTQFEKLAEDSKQKITVQVSKSQSSNSLITIFLSRKFSITALVLFSLSILVIIGFIGCTNSRIIDNTMKINQILRQGSITKQAVISVFLSNWIKYLNSTQIRSKEENIVLFGESYHYLQQRSFLQQFFNNPDQTVLQQSMYLDVCTLITKDNKNRVLLDQCVEQIGKLTQMQLISNFTTSQLKIWNGLQNDPSNPSNIQSLCSDMIRSLNYLIPGIVSSWQIGSVNLNTSLQQNASFLKITFYVLVSILVLFVFYILWNSYHRLINIVKLEILTIDTPKDLYEYEYFRPYLNRMYYRYYK